jgi:hypothetical protein
VFLTKEEFKAIEKALMLLPNGEEFRKLNKEEQDIIVNANVTMINLLKKRKKNNKKTAEYIAEKRKKDSNYARSK